MKPNKKKGRRKKKKKQKEQKGESEGYVEEEKSFLNEKL